MLAKLTNWLAGHRQGIALAVTFVLVAAGFFAIGYGVASQQSAPSPASQAIGQLPSGNTNSAASTPILGYSKPVSVQIPAINVSAKIIPIGKNQDGTIAVPKGNQRNDAAWYQDSVAPGQAGAAVIEGHVDTYSGPSVFFKLGELKPGDNIYIQRADGRRLTFAVQALREYQKSNFPTSMFYHGDGQGSELHLTTCTGDFSQTSDSYSQNLVVYAVLTSATGN